MKSIRYALNSKGAHEAQEVTSTNGLRLLNDVGQVNDASMGFQIAYDTLTYIKKLVTTQKFYEVEPAKYVPIAVGEGAFAQNILTNLDYSTGGDFEAGFQNTGSNNDRLAQVDAAVSSKTVKIMNWAKGIGYSLIELEQALMANNWDPVAAKERARKRNWDLGIQSVAFLGSKSNPVDFPGLLTSGEININTTLITKPISSMNAAELNTFVQTLIAAYFDNTNSTALPDRFVMPYDDFFGLQNMTPNVIGTGEGNYPISRIEFLERAFKAASQNPGFKIEPLAYAQAKNNAGHGIDKQIYLLYRYDVESVRMDIPVDYTSLVANTLNGFQFQSAAYGQFTGVHFYRPLEALQFEYTPGS
jgi:hypothetical protein